VFLAGAAASQWDNIKTGWNALTKGLGNVMMSEGGADGGEPRAGEAGGPGAGKDFSDKTKDKIRDRDGNTCVFCGKETTSESGPDRSEIDHSIPKREDGNNSENNGQNTCRTCNRQKGGKNTGDYLGWLSGLLK
jgi:hypothetical protein